MLNNIRKIFLLPSLSQWRTWSLPSKHTTVGLFMGIVSLALTIYAFLPNKSSEKEAARKSIESVVAIRAAEVKAIAEINRNFRPSPNFTSQKGVIAESDKFNDHFQKLNDIFNLPEVHRLFIQYGNKQQRAELSSRINRVHDTALAASNFLVALANSSGPQTQQELNQLTTKYLSLLNDITAAQSSLHGFVVGLTAKYFGY
jgi:hypothetical protein